MLASLLCSILVYTKYFPFRADAAVGANITATAELLLKASLEGPVPLLSVLVFSKVKEERPLAPAGTNWRPLGPA